MHALMRRFHTLLVAIAALALSAGLVFASPPPAATGLANAGSHSGRTVPVAGGAVNASEDEDEGAGEDEAAGENEDADDPDEDAGDDQDEDVEGAEDTETEADADAAGDHCATDPSALTPEELDAMNHGSIVCWAAHQAEWPEWFANHGAFVRCWAHQGKADATSCTEDPTAEPAAPVAEKADRAGKGGGHGNGKAKGQAKGHSKHVE